MFFKLLGLVMAGLAVMFATGNMGEAEPVAALMPATVAVAVWVLGVGD